ncbi:hypothetical protein [Herbaspirillum robiniae]|jgi:hypothetical protein|uniref:Uncharacterized protein n=1 Tax=Herbaspirillum robiniae TaxID=2014887 RepID=A0A2D0B670_9BURK|nr:hypothetical protein [Herbaspirillum robiniae]NUU01749.1 hypothetical protein [Herbaspirillum robiniae]OWY29866.1 hypothetical protein CEJ42_08430 [Herbaspirillum robiniae]
MEMATIASGVATAWLANKAAESVGIDLTKVAKEAADDVIGAVAAVGRLPSNINIGRIINTIA